MAFIPGKTGALVDACRNKLIATLPSDEYREVRPQLRSVPLVSQQVLHKRGEAVRAVYFPGGGVCSMLPSPEEGQPSEIAAIGNEGVVGASVFFGERVAAGDTVVSVGGAEGYVMDVSTFNETMGQRRGFHNLVVRYSQAMIGQAIQLTACSRLHRTDARACRWFLTAYDRVGRDEFPLSCRLLPRVLGVPPATAARIVTGLARARLIECRGGQVRIVNRTAMQGRACECYSLISGIFGRLLPELVNARAHDAVSRYGNG
jgi:hypothetical protein